MPSKVSLGQLIALNDEILALTRCGVPLEQGLADLGSDLPGRLGKISTSIAARLDQGASLAEVLEDMDGQFPPVYRAVVEAGIRGGRLSAALEGLATSIRRVAELRRLVGLALVYPLVVLALACGLFALVVPRLASDLLASHQAQRIPATAGFENLTRLTNAIGVGVLLIPVAAVLAALVWWWRSRRAMAAQTSRLGRGTSLVPQLGRLLRAGRTATFLEVLSLLIEQQVPLGEALRLASAASGDRRLIKSADALADQLERGGTPPESSWSLEGIPPLVTWRILRGGSHKRLADSLCHSAETYRRRTRHLSDWLTRYLPMLTTLVVGGTATAIFVFCVFVPWFRFLSDVARPL